MDADAPAIECRDTNRNKGEEKVTPKNFDIYIAISCTWLPSWISYLAIAKTENFEYSRLLKLLFHSKG